MRCRLRSMPPKNMLSLLEGGDRRTIGRSDEVAAMVSKNPELFPRLVRGLWSEDPLVRMRAADATEKVTRLHLNGKERQRATFWLNTYLKDRSAIVKTFALQGLADLAQDHPTIRPRVIKVLRESARNGTPAMKARSRNLLLRLERIGRHPHR